MSNLKLLRTRVRSVKSTQKITKAMQLVSAAKLKKIKGLLHDSDDYLGSIKKMVLNIRTNSHLLDLSGFEQKFFSGKGQEGDHLLILYSSERGLCGSFNSSLIKKVKSDIAKLQEEKKKYKLVVIGKKGFDLLKSKFSDNIIGFYQGSLNEEEYLNEQIRNNITSLTESDKLASCMIYYNKFKNAMTQVVTKEQIFPLVAEGVDMKGINAEYEGKGVIKAVIDLFLVGELRNALLQSKASEEGARMTAMDSATKNASDLIDALTLKLNRTRQAMITKELIEIISGAQAV